MRVAIAGAGNVGRSIARELLDNGHQVLLIERQSRAMKVDTVPEADWLQADEQINKPMDKVAADKYATEKKLMRRTPEDCQS